MGFLFSLSSAEMLVASNTALNSPDNFLHLQDASTEFKIANTKTQQLGAGAQVRNSRWKDYEEACRLQELELQAYT